MIDKYRYIQTLNGKLGEYTVDDYVTEFHPYTKDSIKDLIGDLLLEIEHFDRSLEGDIIITESLATYIIDNIDPTFFDNTSCFNIVEDVDIISANIGDEEPYYGVHLNLQEFKFKPNPIKLNVNWQALSEKDIENTLGKSAQDLLVEAATEEILKSTGIPPKYLS
jgi:hypothetical protein